MAHQSDPNPWVEAEFILHSRDISQALLNLNHLIGVHAESPALVRSYADQAEQRLRALGELLRSLKGNN
jgi:hypothetical protein